MGHGALAAWLADVPDFDTPFSTGVDVTCGVANGNGAHHLAVAQRVDLPGVAWNPRANQGVWREGHGLHLPVSADVEGVRPDGRTRWRYWVQELATFQKEEEEEPALRFAPRDGGETGRKAWGSHVCVRIETLRHLSR